VGFVKYRLVRSPLGNIVVAGDREGLRRLEFQRGRDGEFPIPREWEEDPEFPLLRRAAEQLRSYFSGKRRSFSLPLAPVGTAFQQRVWAELRKIPFGETVSYSELARRAGRPSAIRAAGAANGKNPISIVIPCHRVLGLDGSLTGYGGGLEKKRALLALEGAGVRGHLRPERSRVHAGTMARSL
jgi:methylated-DNA-[protein]-cysteine S-methyltransferase